MSKLAAIVAAVVVMTLVGCSNGPEPDPGQTPEFTGQPTETTSASPTPSTKPAADCLDGEYRLVRFVGVNDQASFGTGEGGDVRMGFDDKTYTLTGAGQDPITLTLAGQQGTLLVDGSIDGTYALKGNQATFKVGKAKGSATAELGGRKETLTMDQVGNVLAPDGKAALACNDQGLIVLLTEVRLEFEPV